MSSYMEAARNQQEYDECEHGVPGSADCVECLKRRHKDEILCLEEEISALERCIESAICMLAEGPDAIGGVAARDEAIRILREGLGEVVPTIDEAIDRVVAHFASQQETT